MHEGREGTMSAANSLLHLLDRSDSELAIVLGSDRLTIQLDSLGNSLCLSFGAGTFRAKVTGRHFVPVPGASSEFSVFLMTGQLLAGSVLIAVNCCEVPPSLAIGIRSRDEERSWRWSINHSIQHRIVTMLGKAAQQAGS